MPMFKFNRPKPWKAECAKSARSRCKACKKIIAIEILRLGKMVSATQFDGFMARWSHASCIMKKPHRIQSINDVEGIESLRWEDQQNIRKYVEDSLASKNAVKIIEYGIELSQTSRAACKCCRKKIMQGEVRISSTPEGKKKAKVLAWHHANCFMDLNPSIRAENLSGWGNLSASDQEAFQSLVKEALSTAKTDEGKEDEEVQQTTSKAGGKRRIDIGSESSDQKSKFAKGEGDVSTSKATSAKKDFNFDSKLETQNKELWALKDDLKGHVTTIELRAILEANGQNSTGSELDLRDQCADGMMFGALASCPICSGALRYSGGMYRCHGYLSEWSKCSYSTHEPKRLKGKWKIPEEMNNQYLSKWFKSQKSNKPARILPLPSSDNPSGYQATKRPPQSSPKSVRALPPALYNPSGSQETNSQAQSSESETLGDLKGKIEGAGGQFHTKVKKDTNCLVVNEALSYGGAEIRKAKRTKLPIVRKDYLVARNKTHKQLLFDLYKVEALCGSSVATVRAKEPSAVDNVVSVRVKGQNGVHGYSGLQDAGHILEDGNSTYNTTLSKSDLSTGVNRYYILQIIQDDKGPRCHVFRKWGRVGDEEIGGSKLEPMSKMDAIIEFKRLFFQKTANLWEAWEQKRNFRKKPGRFFPLDIDYGVPKQVTIEYRNNTDSKLAPPVVELMKMLFDVKTYRAVMMEFEINMSEMPLGKLSKNNIQKGFEALTDIQNLLNSNAYDPSVKESLIVDASNRFFTVIPSVYPHVIRNEDDFKSKVEMLEALQDIEIASRLVGFDANDNESLDDKYKKLHCDISPLPHDTEDYQLIEKYLLTTHAPTHNDWSLELEEVFSLERKGEFDRFTPYQEKLKNRMLLWHGSRLTNFVGILSQGLRIAPPNAPTTGYMFGKGIYFADLVSKSAQYCYTTKNDPVGLMLLSEVALGDVYELKNAMYMDNPPDGKHSTKGLGKKMPKKSEFVKWRDDVTVPCGKPVGSNIRGSGLMYNEYIVYNTAQIKMHFLLKVRFHHKRR